MRRGRHGPSGARWGEIGVPGLERGPGNKAPGRPALRPNSLPGPQAPLIAQPTAKPKNPANRQTQQPKCSSPGQQASPTAQPISPAVQPGGPTACQGLKPCPLLSPQPGPKTLPTAQASSQAQQPSPAPLPSSTTQQPSPAAQPNSPSQQPSPPKPPRLSQISGEVANLNHPPLSKYNIIYYIIFYYIIYKYIHFLYNII